MKFSFKIDLLRVLGTVYTKQYGLIIQEIILNLPGPWLIQHARKTVLDVLKTFRQNYTPMLYTTLKAKIHEHFSKLKFMFFVSDNTIKCTNTIFYVFLSADCNAIGLK